MKKYQKTALIEVVGTANDGDYLVQNEGNDTDQWVIPKETFETTYDEVKHDFGWAIHQLKKGHKVSRRGWNGRGMFAVYQKGYPQGIPCNKQTAEAWGLNEGDLFKVRPYLQLKTAQGDHAMWNPSTSDVLAEDWEVVE